MNLSWLVPFDLSPWQWGALIFSSLCLGMSKTAMGGISMVAIPLFALVFGPKPSTGVILPLICLADIFAVAWYRRHAQWRCIAPLLPWALAGFAAALFADRLVPAKGFKALLGGCVLLCLGIMLWKDFYPKLRGKTAAPKTPAGGPRWAPAVFGVIGGFSTMIGNAAGPVMALYLLSMRLPKESFVGTTAWFFLILNYLKIPLQVFAWHNITREGLRFGLALAPFVLAGVWLGILLTRRVSEGFFRAAVYALTIIAAALLLLV